MRKKKAMCLKRKDLGLSYGSHLSSGSSHLSLKGMGWSERNLSFQTLSECVPEQSMYLTLRMLGLHGNDSISQSCVLTLKKD